jgi:enoyl-CoA hydratase
MASKATATIEEGIAWIAIDDGKVNAMSVEMMREIGECLDVAEAARAVAVLKGRDGIFSAGFDLGTFKRGPEEVRSMLVAGARLIERLLAFPRPVLAACTGHAYPMGAFLMLSSDVRIGVRGPWRIGMNETAIALTVPWFAIEIARHRLTPPAFARIQSAAMFTPADAVAAGYLDAVVDADSLEEAVRAEAVRLCALDATSFAATKARVNERALAGIRRSIETELAA